MKIGTWPILGLSWGFYFYQIRMILFELNNYIWLKSSHWNVYCSLTFIQKFHRTKTIAFHLIFNPCLALSPVKGHSPRRGQWRKQCSLAPPVVFQGHCRLASSECSTLLVLGGVLSSAPPRVCRAAERKWTSPHCHFKHMRKVILHKSTCHSPITTGTK